MVIKINLSLDVHNLRIVHICLLINLVFVLAEAFVGWKSNSTGLMSDAGHNLSDTVGLLLALIALHYEQTGNRKHKLISRFTTLLNTALLFGAVMIIIYESVGKIISPSELDSQAVILTASFAIVVNGLTSWLLMRDNKENINIRAAYLHAATDTLVSAGIVISGIIIKFTGWYIIDPIISLGISVLILIPTIRLFCITIKSPLK